MSVLYDDVQMDQYTARNTKKKIEIYAVNIKISMTKYHHWINCQAYLYSNTALYGEIWVR